MGIRESLHKMAVFQYPVIGFLGFAALVYGCWLIYPPASWIVGGGLLLADVLHATRRKTHVD